MMMMMMMMMMMTSLKFFNYSVLVIRLYVTQFAVLNACAATGVE